MRDWTIFGNTDSRLMVMDALQRGCVSLLIDEDDLVPSEVTALLGVEPHLGVSKGEMFLGNNSRYIQAKTGKWALRRGWKSPVGIGNEIAELLSMLTDDLRVWDYLTERFHCYLSVGGYFEDWTGGITLDASTLKLLADRNLTIDFDLYAPAASEPPADGTLSGG